MNTWRGFERVDFEFEGHACILVRPHQAAEGNPWVWRAEFFDAFAQADEAMAKKGWHIAYVKLSDRYGCPSAVEDMESFRKHMVKEYGLHEKPAIFGFSRGGLYTVNYALTYPEHTGKIYIDAPVLDIRSWPGGKGKGCGSEKCWLECMECYGLTEETAKSFDRNPLDRAEELAKTGIPAIIVAGASEWVGSDAAAWRAVGVPVMVVTTMPLIVANLAMEAGCIIPEGDLVAPIGADPADVRAANGDPSAALLQGVQLVQQQH